MTALSPERGPVTADRLLSAPALAAHLHAGGAALFPTDTLPALAALPEFADQLWQRKLRPADKPLILMGADLESLRSHLGCPWAPPWEERARSCWPGAFTLVLPLAGATTEALNPRGTTLGLRVPACSLARDLLHLTGPLATTSANLSGHPAATCEVTAGQQFPDLPLLAPLPWPAGSGTASTVLAWEGEEAWRVVRPGASHPSPAHADPEPPAPPAAGER